MTYRTSEVIRYRFIRKRTFGNRHRSLQDDRIRASPQVLNAFDARPDPIDLLMQNVDVRKLIAGTAYLFVQCDKMVVHKQRLRVVRGGKL